MIIEATAADHALLDSQNNFNTFIIQDDVQLHYKPGWITYYSCNQQGICGAIYIAVYTSEIMIMGIQYVDIDAAEELLMFLYNRYNTHHDIHCWSFRRIDQVSCLREKNIFDICAELGFKLQHDHYNPCRKYMVRYHI